MTTHRTNQGTYQKYNIDFALMVLTGNITRYKIVRPLVERDSTIIARWYPIRTWFEGDPLSFLPAALRFRMRHFLDSWPAYVNSPAEAIIMHTFETYYIYIGLQRLLGRKTIVIKNQDGLIEQSRMNKFAVNRTDFFVPWSNWGKMVLKREYPEVPDEKILVMHPGLNLDQWPMRTPPPAKERFQLLFIGGDFMRKGGDTLLDAFETELHNDCDLTIATQTAFLPAPMRERIAQMKHVTLHLDLKPLSDTLKQLYQEADCFVMPTRRDSTPWVALEALATGIPLIISGVSGIPDIAIDGETGLIVKPNDPASVVTAVRRLQRDPEFTKRLIQQGRTHVETNFNAERNTERLMSIAKTMIDQRRTK